MRLRTLKPGFFSNEELADQPFAGRLLFAGLWLIADRAGRLEDRPKRIRGELFRYEDVDIDALLNGLAEAGFIRRYQVEGMRYIEIANFSKHQTPHVKEPASTIPAPPEMCQQRDHATRAPDEHQTSTVLAPDKNSARTPLTDIGNLELGTGEYVLGSGECEGADEPPGAAEDIYAHFKAKIQPKSRTFPREKINARLKAFSADELKRGIDNFAADWWWMEHNASQGAEWFFRSDKQAERWLLLKPRASSPVPIGKPPPRAEPSPPYSIIAGRLVYAS